tara:strand:+ start:90 stop:818 length:729 start_codon:yes stop_codon:yes gene_type:complete
MAKVKVRRIPYLNKIKASNRIKIEYLKYILKSIIQKNRRKKIINNYRNFISNKKFTHDFFSPNTFDWSEILYQYKNIKFNYLEIGSFEGISALYILENFSKAKLFCVDPWFQLTPNSGTSEGYEHLKMSEVENNFDNNLSQFNERYIKYKIKSNKFFFENKEKFDVIYIDGSHIAEDVLNDCISSWKILKKDGIILFDDYFWQNYQEIEKNPATAINDFLNMIPNQFIIIKLTKFQLSIRKI